MIAPSELRIGNYVLIGSLVWTPIDGILSSQVFACNGVGINYIDIDPIPITPEWLERLGFETKTGYVIMGRIGLSPTTWIDIMNNGTAEVCGQWNESVAVSPCKYIHELQNLYHAITGNELKIK